jgi:hypothetical protein
MKNKSSNDRLSYFFTPRIHGNVLAWTKPASESERSKRAIENILRWEDDGGRMPDIGDPIGQVKPGYGSGPGKRMMNVTGKGN